MRFPAKKVWFKVLCWLSVILGNVYIFFTMGSANVKFDVLDDREVEETDIKRKLVTTAAKNLSVTDDVINVFAFDFQSDQHLQYVTNQTFGCPGCYVYTHPDDFESSHVVFYNSWGPPPRAKVEKYCGYTDQKLMVVSLMEAPCRRKDEYWYALNGCFHFISSYKSSSDIPTPYGRTVALPNPVPYRVNHSNKSRLAVWMVSHCSTHSFRERYVNLLQQHLDMDVFGDCGNHSCSREDNDQCWSQFQETYYFYLAFENSFCDEYATEKVWHALQHDIIPVVMGSANYDSILPPHSFIHAQNFSSPRLLADFLRSVASDAETYQSYFTWKSFYSITTLHFPFCQMCDMYRKFKTKIASLPVANNVGEHWTARQCHRPINRILKWWEMLWLDLKEDISLML